MMLTRSPQKSTHTIPLVGQARDVSLLHRQPPLSPRPHNPKFRSSPAVKSHFNFGNIAVLQPKLTIGRPDDKYEQEADRVAEQVMQTSDSAVAATPPRTDSGVIQRTCTSCAKEYDAAANEDRPVEQDKLCPECRLQAKPLIGKITPRVQRETENAVEEEEEEMLQANGVSGQTPALIPDVTSGIAVMRVGGQTLSPATRGFMEPRFGRDFSRVRIHTDANAARISRQINARAFTVGPHIGFGAGQYQPNTSHGRKLLAHELTHVVQQTQSADSAMVSSMRLQPKITPCTDQTRLARKETAKEPGGHQAASKGPMKLKPMELGEDKAADIGKTALREVGYETIIDMAVKAGFLAPAKNDGAEGTVQRILVAPADRIFRDAGVVTFGSVFTRYAIAAGVSSQLDSPAPGPGDVVALGILAVGLIVAGYTVLSRDACDIQLIRCLDNPWQPDWNTDFGPRKDCGACFRECKHAGGSWPYYKCPD